MTLQPRTPAALLRSHHEGVRELALVTLFVAAYFGIRNLTAGDKETAYANARRIMRVEHRVHLQWEAALQAPVLSHPVLVTLVNWIYIWGHWPMLITVAILLYRYRRDRYVLLRNAIFVSGAIGFLFFALLPVAPPRLADPALVDTVTLHSHAYRALQPPGLTDQLASFPSLHFGWNLLAGIAIWGATRNAVVRSLSVIGPAAMAAAVILTANHYVVDVLGGLSVVTIALLACLTIGGLTARRHPDGHAARASPRRAAAAPPM